MRGLIVNGDDLGVTPGVNRGVVEAHVRGILTSASMMVDAPASAEAAWVTREYPTLDVGLHVVVDESGGEGQVERQLERFIELVGRLPTHLDSHRNIHHAEPLRAAFLAAAERHRLPLRGYGDIHPIPSFFGQWDGETHPGQISPHGLERILAEEMRAGLNELCCHPGYVDRELASSYARERETELETLCDAEVRALLESRGIRLTTFAEASSP